MCSRTRCWLTLGCPSSVTGVKATMTAPSGSQMPGLHGAQKAGWRLTHPQSPISPGGLHVTARLAAVLWGLGQAPGPAWRCLPGSEESQAARRGTSSSSASAQSFRAEGCGRAHPRLLDFTSLDLLFRALLSTGSSSSLRFPRKRYGFLTCSPVRMSFIRRCLKQIGPETPSASREET